LEDLRFGRSGLATTKYPNVYVHNFHVSLHHSGRFGKERDGCAEGAFSSSRLWGFHLHVDHRKIVESS